ncbi:MFS transporter [Aeromicrobium sp. CF4.19]|uniref:MFS transporter n=1 Tax=Aeromicrobium sp. CF4.19 TaxID=3373082 RepID=UPI003EE6767E
MKRTFLVGADRPTLLSAAGLGLVAATYGLVRLTYGLFLPDVQGSLGLGDGTAGHIASAASLAYCLGALGGFVAADHRARTLVVAAATTAGAGTLGMAVAPSVVVFAPFAVLSSSAAGLASPALVAIVARNVDVDRRDRTQSVVNAGTGPGLVAAGALALALLPHWRPAWALTGVATILLAATVLRLDRPDPSTAPSSRRALPPPTWFREHAVPLGAALLLGAGSAAVWTYGRTLFLQSGASQDASALAWVCIGVGGSAVVATAAPMDRLSPPRAWALTSATTAVSCLALAVAPGSRTLALLAFATFGWGFVAATSSLIAWAARIDVQRAAAGTSVLFVALVAGQSVGAAAMGLTVGLTGLRAQFLAAAVVVATSCVLAVLGTIAPSTRHPEPRRGESSPH